MNRKEKIKNRLFEIRNSCALENRNLSPLETREVESLEAELRTLNSDDALDGSDTQATRGFYKPGTRGRGRADTRNEGSFRDTGDFLAAVIRAGTPGGQTDPRLVETRATPTGMGEMVGSEGGFLMPPNFSDTVLQKAHELSAVASRCKKINLSQGNSLEIPGLTEDSRADGSRNAGIRSYWVEEAGEITASQPAFELLKFKVKKLACLAYLTEEMMSDFSASANLLEGLLADEIAFVLDDAIINGDGVGKPLGILNAPCLVTASAESGQGANTFIGHNIVQMWSQMFAACRKNAVWFINQNVEPQLLRAAYQDDVASPAWGHPVFLPPGGISGAPYGTILGKPVIPIEQAASLGDLGDVILADMSSYYLVQRGGLNTATSMHVRFIYDEMAIKCTLRVDGQPSWSSALTPYKQEGSETLSPFVVLSGTRT